MTHEYGELKDIPLPDEFIDIHIQDLVRAVNAFGLRTNESCEGHFGRRPYVRPQPWVVLWLFPPLGSDGRFDESRIGEVVEKKTRLQYIVDAYNLNSPVEWILKQGYLKPTNVASDLTELTLLQASANDLARFIFNNVNTNPPPGWPFRSLLY